MELSSRLLSESDESDLLSCVAEMSDASVCCFSLISRTRSLSRLSAAGSSRSFATLSMPQRSRAMWRCRSSRRSWSSTICGPRLATSAREYFICASSSSYARRISSRSFFSDFFASALFWNSPELNSPRRNPSNVGEGCAPCEPDARRLAVLTAAVGGDASFELATLTRGARAGFISRGSAASVRLAPGRGERRGAKPLSPPRTGKKKPPRQRLPLAELPTVILQM